MKAIGKILAGALIGVVLFGLLIDGCTYVITPPVEIDSCSDWLIANNIDLANTSNKKLRCQAYLGGDRSPQRFTIAPYSSYTLWVGKADKVTIKVDGYILDLIYEDNGDGTYFWRYD